MTDLSLSTPIMPAYHDTVSPAPKISARNLNFFYGGSRPYSGITWTSPPSG